jgi:hypothetical protein
LGFTKFPYTNSPSQKKNKQESNCNYMMKKEDEENERARKNWVDDKILHLIIRRNGV